MGGIRGKVIGWRYSGGYSGGGILGGDIKGGGILGEDILQGGILGRYSRGRY